MVCGDFKVTLRPVLDWYPSPHIDDLFTGLAEGRNISRIALNQIYLQIHVDEKSKELLHRWSRFCVESSAF